MKPRRFTPDGAPLASPPRRSDASSRATHSAVTTQQTTTKDRFGYVCMTAVIGMMAWLVYWGTTGGFGVMTPSVMESPPTNAYGSFALPIASPIAIQFPRELVIVTNTPPPQTPTPVSTYVAPTPLPVIICGNWAQIGQSCTMPKLPDPTSTPIPDCPAGPDETCVWTGRAEDASPIAPTPYPTMPIAHQSTRYGTPPPMVML